MRKMSNSIKDEVNDFKASDEDLNKVFLKSIDDAIIFIKKSTSMKESIDVFKQIIIEYFDEDIADLSIEGLVGVLDASAVQELNASKINKADEGALQRYTQNLPQALWNFLDVLSHCGIHSPQGSIFGFLRDLYCKTPEMGANVFFMEKLPEQPDFNFLPYAKSFIYADSKLYFFSDSLAPEEIFDFNLDFFEKKKNEFPHQEHAVYLNSEEQAAYIMGREKNIFPIGRVMIMSLVYLDAEKMVINIYDDRSYQLARLMLVFLKSLDRDAMVEPVLGQLPSVNNVLKRYGFPGKVHIDFEQMKETLVFRLAQHEALQEAKKNFLDLEPILARIQDLHDFLPQLGQMDDLKSKIQSMQNFEIKQLGDLNRLNLWLDKEDEKIIVQDLMENLKHRFFSSWRSDLSNNQKILAKALLNDQIEEDQIKYKHMTELSSLLMMQDTQILLNLKWLKDSEKELLREMINLYLDLKSPYAELQKYRGEIKKIFESIYDDFEVHGQHLLAYLNDFKLLDFPDLKWEEIEIFLAEITDLIQSHVLSESCITNLEFIYQELSEHPKLKAKKLFNDYFGGDSANQVGGKFGDYLLEREKEYFWYDLFSSILAFIFGHRFQTDKEKRLNYLIELKYQWHDLQLDRKNLEEIVEEDLILDELYNNLDEGLRQFESRQIGQDRSLKALLRSFKDDLSDIEEDIQNMTLNEFTWREKPCFLVPV